MTDDRERLQLGREKRPTPKPDYPPDAGLLTRIRARHRARHEAKKARLAAMTRGRRVARRFMIGGTWLLGLIAAVMVALIVLYFAFTDVPRPESLPLPQSASIEYADGTTLAKIGSVDRTVVHLEQVPEHVRWAVLAAEDRNFYSEPGVSIRGTIRAALSDLTGGDTQGGSGITQQYVRNAYASVGTEKTITRKLKELMIAVKLSRDYSKDQILEYYLNTVYFGRGAYGIQAAAQAFFGENVEKLTVAQGALLAGLLRSPAYYDPANNPAAAKQRWYYVLDGMVKTHHLTAAQESALKFPKTKPPKGTGLVTTGWRALLVNAVLAELQAHGISDKEVSDRGLTIRTTIDRKAQSAALKAIHTTFAHLTKKQRNMKNALTAINPSNGAVLAYYGGSGPGVKGYDGKIDYHDWAGQFARPPGSSFKPYTLATVLTQTIKKTPGKRHLAIDSHVDGSYCKKIAGTKICNDPSDQGVSSPSVTVANAMKYSLNTTFDSLAYEAGPDNVAATAHAMGISKTLPNGQKSLVQRDGHSTFGIGIGDYPVTPLNQATGFATLANDGETNQPFLVQKATASDGTVVYTHKDAPKKGLDRRVANDVTITLKPVAAWSNDALADGRQSAAKTGTEGISPNSKDNSDAWMVGFTPQVSAVVWVGTGYSRPIYNAAGLPEYGADMPGKTWKLFMDTYLAGKPKLKLPSKQLIDANGGVPKPTPTFVPKPITSAPSSNTPTPTPTTSTPTPTPTTSTQTVTLPPPPTPTPTSSPAPICIGHCKSTSPGPRP